jgi:hypothetical protein
MDASAESASEMKRGEFFVFFRVQMMSLSAETIFLAVLLILVLIVGPPI